MKLRGGEDGLILERLLTKDLVSGLQVSHGMTVLLSIVYILRLSLSV